MRDKIPPLMWRNIFIGVSAFMVVGMFVYYIFPGAFLAEVIAWLSALAEIGTLVAGCFFWRCPECGKPLPFVSMSTHRCPFCGEYLYY